MRRLTRLTAPRAPVVEQHLRAALAEVGPLLRLDTAHLELVDFDAATGVARVSVAGGCAHCDLSVATFHAAVQAHVQRRVPQVREVRITGG